MRKVFEIPLPNYLVRFAEKQLWNGHRSYPLPVDEGSLLGQYIYSVLIDKRNPSFSNLDFDSQLVIELSNTLAKRSPDLVKLSRVKRFLEESFHLCLVVWVNAQMESGSGRWAAVEHFVKFYGISEDMISGLYQYVKRYQNSPVHKRRNEKRKKEKDTGRIE